MHTPITGKIISGADALSLLCQSLKEAESGDLVLATAYLKFATLERVTASLSPHVRVQILTRWQPRDLASRASDIECYDFSHRNGWRFYIKQNFHGKVYLFSDRLLLVGSANLTGAGTAGDIDGNQEAVVSVTPTGQNKSTISEFFSGSTMLTPELVNRMHAWLDCDSVNESIASENLDRWPREFLPYMHPSKVGVLLVSECFWSDASWLFDNGPEDEHLRHDVSLCGWQSIRHARCLPQDKLLMSVESSKMFGWLLEMFEASRKREFYFGELCSLLHTSLVDDPKPFRKDVKSLISNLLCWIKHAGCKRVRVDKPRHSQRVRMDE